MTQTLPSAPISTPCIGICQVAAATRLCAGCGRTLEEIARWGSMSEAERRAIMAGLADRLATACAATASFGPASGNLAQP